MQKGMLRVALFAALLSACREPGPPPDAPASSARNDQAPAPAHTSIPSRALTEPIRLQGEKASVGRFGALPQIAVWNDATVIALYGHGERISVWHGGGEDRRDASIPGCSTASLDPSGSRVAALVSSPKEELRVVDLSTGATSLSSERSASEVSWVGERLLLTGRHAGETPIFLDLGGKTREAIQMPYNSTFVAASEDGDTLIMHRSGALSSWLDFYHRDQVKRVEDAVAPRAAAIVGETALFVMQATAFDPDNPPNLWAAAVDVTSGVERDVASDIAYRPTAVGPARDGFVLGYEDGHVALIDRALKLVATFPGSGAVVAVDISPDQTKIAAAHEDGTIVVLPVGQP